MIVVLVQSDPDHKRQEQKFQINGRTEGMLSNCLQNFQHSYYVKGIQNKMHEITACNAHY